MQTFWHFCPVSYWLRWLGWFLNMNKLSLAPLSSRALSHGTLPSISLKSPKLWFAFCPSFRILNSSMSWSLQHKVVFNLNILPKSFIVVEYEACYSTSSLWLLHSFCQEHAINALQEPPWLPVLCCVVSSAVNEYPQQEHGLQTWRYFSLSVEGL